MSEDNNGYDLDEYNQSCDKCQIRVGLFGFVEVEGGVECEVCQGIIDFGELKGVCEGCFNEAYFLHVKQEHKSVDLV